MSGREGDLERGHARVLGYEGMEGGEVVGKEKSGLAVLLELDVGSPGTEEAGEAGEVVVEGLRQVGTDLVRAFDDDGGAGGFLACGGEVAQVDEVEMEVANGLDGVVREVLVFAEAGDEILAAESADALAEVVGEDDVELGENDFCEKVGQGGKGAVVAEGEEKTVVDVAVEDKGAGGTAGVAVNEFLGPGWEHWVLILPLRR